VAIDEREALRPGVVIPPAQAAPPAARHRPRRWQRRYRRLVVGADATTVLLALFAALVLRFRTSDVVVDGIHYAWLSVAVGMAWAGSLAAHRAYDLRFLGVDVAEYKRVVWASVRLFGALAIVAYSLKWELTRGFVAYAFPIGTGLLLAERNLARKWLHRKRAGGRCSYRVLAVGDRRHVRDLIATVRRERHAGFTVVGACVPGGDLSPVTGVPVLGPLGSAPGAARLLDVDVVAVTASPGVTSDGVRRLSWELAGSGVEMVLAPSLTDIAGPRIAVRPVAGLPFLHVEEPEFGFLRQVLKGGVDRFVALVALVVLLPAFAVLALLIRLTSRGPAFFRQARVGLDGRVFQLIKFRSMRRDAEDLLDCLRVHNESDGLLFKLRADPRITGFGRWLRRFSVDELPQLINVVKGEMSLVGPRPLPVAPNDFNARERRRLLVKPGITGLWQISGRSAVSWEDTVRLDLYYVENWSLTLDLVILWKTIFAVLKREGAY
jgi:exopolysaccharide biosynthesis polyprenyl glycosylphosphotransferase